MGEYLDINFGGYFDESLLHVNQAPLGKVKDNGIEIAPAKQLSETRRVCLVCQKATRQSQALCKDHYKEFGARDKWPEWLKALDTDYQRLLDYKRNNPAIVTLSNDEIFMKQPGYGPAKYAKAADTYIPGMIGSRTQASYNRDEISNDDVAWDGVSDQPGEGYEPGAAIRGDRSGYAYNDRAWRGNEGQYSELAGTWERDLLDEKIDAQRELDRLDLTRKNVLLLSAAGYNQQEIANHMRINQQRVSEILRMSKTKTVK